MGRFSRGLVSPPNVWVAVPFEHEVGSQQTTLSAAKGLSKSSRRSLKELPRSLVTERESSEPGTRRRARVMRIDNPDQRSDREVIEGTGASSSRDSAGNEAAITPQLNRVPVLISLRENRAMMQ